ncbi:MAG: hypothetical protein EWV55_05480 [Microcystis viridis Mv_BB_P_19951000_S69]|uniref:Uncharacterized protein n=1 Tax=Microcystis viridis Mv_BB_P_19951000_S68D TaxID=2486270 RepID=A0A552HVU6_MICVR|nr:MAG: hypothetical protein EWV47_11270 [Microcystis viridis Mv_BB_P_19951000_S68]TRU75340.1 MAG: hypothetical protein EWV77_08725 [Microcystis viridis Mv_BB_P_19951000_S68D]TRU77160.1 MAG: hypothetical protein EWV55_05480 [Microcystis viridis Mv_BB_P_19951000_S69]TRU81067.1 MAG: hypothetical protein EWV46_21860 [Microcystis viridis Mv_BB_P_19951000_S69D]
MKFLLKIGKNVIIWDTISFLTNPKELIPIYQLSVISDQLSMIRFEFSVNSIKWQVLSFLFTDY